MILNHLKRKIKVNKQNKMKKNKIIENQDYLEIKEFELNMNLL